MEELQRKLKRIFCVLPSRPLWMCVQKKEKCRGLLFFHYVDLHTEETEKMGLVLWVLGFFQALCKIDLHAEDRGETKKMS